MTDHVDAILEALSKVPRLAVMAGTYVGLVDGQYTVDAGNRVPVTMWCPEPQIGDAVNVLSINGALYVTGMVTPPPTEGTVRTTNAARVQVETDQGMFTVPYLTGYTPASGNVVQLGYSKSAGLHITGVLSDDVTPAEVPPAPVVSSVRPPGLVTATWSGSARRGTSNWFTNRVWASASNIGAYGYGSKVADTFAVYGIPNRIDVYLPAVSNKYGNMRLGWHPYETRSGVTPAVTSLRIVGTGWVDITDLGPQLAAGGGIGFDGAGETVYQGIPMGGQPGDTQAGALRLTYN